MTKAEYDLYKKICKLATGYPLRIFYLTVLAPGEIAAVREFKKKVAAEKTKEIPKLKVVSSSKEEKVPSPILPVQEEKNEESSDETTDCTED